jgi:hypothetical protein
MSITLLENTPRSVVYVIAVWGMPKDGFPPLDDPR